jgi:hypothetical protein
MFTKVLINTLYDSKINFTQLCNKMGMSLQNLSNKKIRDNFTEAEMQKIANALDMELVIKLVPKGEKQC